VVENRGIKKSEVNLQGGEEKRGKVEKAVSGVRVVKGMWNQQKTASSCGK